MNSKFNLFNYTYLKKDMKNTLKIQKLIGIYKEFTDYSELIKEVQPETLEYYKFIKMDTLREIAKLKSESPTSYRFACALDKLILN